MPDSTVPALNWLDKTLWTFVFIVLCGFVGRTLIDDRPIDKRRFAGELILTVIGAVGVYFSGLLQGLGAVEMIVAACLCAMGGIHLLGTLGRVYKTLIKASQANG